MRRAGIPFLILLALAAPAFAVQPDETLKDAGLESRARALSSQLRCLICQNQSIDDSDAPLAKDLRILLRERISAGDSDLEVKDFLVARYGEFILLRPRFSLSTALLWLTPILVLGLGLLGIFYARRASPPADTPLSVEEKARLERLLR